VYCYKTDETKQVSHASWEKKLDQAFFEERFVLFQQSAYNKNREIHDQEVLIRLTDVDGIIRSAGYFMPFIEQLNRIEEIDKFVIKSAIHFLQLQSPRNAIAINLSKSILENVLFKDWFIKTLIDAKGIVSNISFELSERLIFEEKGTAWPLISELKKLGVGFGIDHFGSGLTNMSYLQTLQPDYIKLDPSFSKSITDDEKTKSYIESLCGLTNSLDIKIIATSIENKAQQKNFSVLGIKYFQGYYYGAPTALAHNTKL